MTMTGQSDDYHLRHQVADPAFSAEQDRIHQEAMIFLEDALAKGRKWPQASAALRVEDAGFKEIVLADFLKVLLAKRHFQGGEGLKGIARELGVTVSQLLALKENMIHEVREASEQVYRLSKT
ncbi:MAG: hypothetical protein HQM02_03155 [Magnetococcales bacterium]|nr:hypothetical protein [Magnetococcales bacterium]